MPHLLATIVEAATVTDTNGDTVELARIQPDGSLGDPASTPDTDVVEGSVVEDDTDAVEDSDDAAGTENKA